MVNHSGGSADDEGPSPNRIRRMKLDIDETALALLETQVSQLTLTLTGLEDTLVRTQAAINVARDSLDAARSRRDALLHDVLEQRNALGALERFPDELLVAIFECCAAPPLIDWPNGLMRGSAQRRARAPYTCAAVSKRWRRAAIEAPHIWRYIAIPRLSQHDVDGGCYQDYVDTALERSKSAPLVVVFDLIDSAFEIQYTDILERISLHIHRWEAFAARLSDHRPTPALLSCLRSGPTPTLKRVFIGVRPGDDYEFLDSDQPSIPVHSRYLFYAPRLLDLLVEHLPLPLRSASDIMVDLHKLTVFQTQLTDSFWTLLSASPALRSLIVLTQRGLAAGPSDPVVLPSLVSLHVAYHAWRLLNRFPRALVVPRLEELYVSSGPPHQLDEFFVCIAPTLARLRLHFVTIEPDDIPALQTLAGLSVLELLTSTVTPLLFDRLSQREECMWPRLAQLTLSGVTLRPASGESLVEFVRARARSGPATEGQGAHDPWCPLQAVTFAEGHNVPRGDVAEITYLLSHA